MIYRIPVIAFVIASFGSIPVAAQSSKPVEQKLSEIVEPALKESGAPSVSVAVVENGKLSYAKAFGKVNIEANRDATGRTRYAVGSVSKQFTVAAILLLEERHKLSLDDKVAKYFPDLTRANEVTLRELLSHTSGYEDYAPQDYIIPEWTKPTTPQAILNQWAKKPLNFDPGTRWQYSNTNYVLAGGIFEKASGEKLLNFLSAKIFEPLGMKSAGDCEAASPEDATAYTRYALGPPRPVEREASGWYFAAGELCMTPSDLALWDIAFLQKKILSQKSYEEFTREVKLKNGDLTGYALGLSVGAMRNVPTISHSGEVSGFLASNTIFPTRNGAVVVLSNEDGIDLIGPLSRRIGALLFLSAQPLVSDRATPQVKTILEELQKGEINRQQFTENANSYFTESALRDYQTSLTPLRELKSVVPVNESLRGGMTHRTYRAQFDRKTVLLNIYIMPDGKYEQFLVEEQSQ